MTVYLTGDQLLERLTKRRCDDCGAEIQSDVECVLVSRGRSGLRFTIDCPFCGATESFEAVASGN